MLDVPATQVIDEEADEDTLTRRLSPVQAALSSVSVGGDDFEEDLQHIGDTIKDHLREYAGDRGGEDHDNTLTEWNAASSKGRFDPKGQNG